MKSLINLLEHHLKDIYSAETQLMDFLPIMIKNSTDKRLKKIFEGHLSETKKQKNRLEEICDELDIDPEGVICKAMEGLIKEADELIKANPSTDVLNAGLIAQAQRIEHYEIASYGTVVQYATELEFKEIASKLQKSLNEEYNTDVKLSTVAENELNRKAK